MALDLANDLGQPELGLTKLHQLRRNMKKARPGRGRRRKPENRYGGALRQPSPCPDLIRASIFFKATPFFERLRPAIESASSKRSKL
jgi:hypothetical protein